MSHVISARIGDALYNSLTKIAKERNRKLSDVLQESLGFYLEEHADYSIALERLHNPLDKIISGKELMQKLNWQDVDVSD